MIKNKKGTAGSLFLFCAKIFLIIMLFFSALVVYQMFGITQLHRLSRHTAIFTITYVVSIWAFMKIYGDFDVLNQRKESLMFSMCISALMSNVVVYVTQCVMEKRIINLLCPLVIAVFQSILVIAIVYFVNTLYFQLVPPAVALVIYGDEDALPVHLAKLGRAKKSYSIQETLHFSDEEVHHAIRRADTVFLADLPEKTKAELLDYSYKYSKHVVVFPDLTDIVVNRAKVVMFDDTPTLSCRQPRLRFEQRFAKRAMDIVIAAVGFVITSPIFLTECLMIKLYDHGPIFYTQNRATINGRVFKLYKFRTMVENAEAMGVTPCAGEKDPRITPVGRILRATRMDELPQLLNILMGDMSMVGPRPERVEHVQMYSEELPEFRYRLKVKAGLTGYAQIYGKYNTTPLDKLRLDMIYIENYSIWMDLRIMFQTLKIIFMSESTEGFDDSRQHEIQESTEKQAEQE